MLKNLRIFLYRFCILCFFYKFSIFTFSYLYHSGNLDLRLVVIFIIAYYLQEELYNKL